MKIKDILNEGPFDNIGKKEPVPAHIASAKKAGTTTGIQKGLDQWAGTNVFGDNKVKSIHDVEQDVDRLDIASKKALLVKLQQELGKQASPSNIQPPSPAAPTTPAKK